MRIDQNIEADPRKFRCAICEVKCQDRHGFQTHLSGQKHHKKVKLQLLNTYFVLQARHFPVFFRPQVLRRFCSFNSTGVLGFFPEDKYMGIPGVVAASHLVLNSFSPRTFVPQWSPRQLVRKICQQFPKWFGTLFPIF